MAGKRFSYFINKNNSVLVIYMFEILTDNVVNFAQLAPGGSHNSGCNLICLSKMKFKNFCEFISHPSCTAPKVAMHDIIISSPTDVDVPIS